MPTWICLGYFFADQFALQLCLNSFSKTQYLFTSDLFALFLLAYPFFLHINFALFSVCNIVMIIWFNYVEAWYVMYDLK